MATWTAVNVTVSKKLKQVEGAGVAPGNINYTIEFFSEILKDGLFHHNYSGTINAPDDGDFEGFITRIMQNQLALWGKADGIEDNGTLKLANPITVPLTVDPTPVDPAVIAFNEALFNLQKLKPLIDLGIIPSDDPVFTDAVSVTQKAYQAKVSVTTSIVAESPVQQKV